MSLFPWFTPVMWVLCCIVFSRKCTLAFYELIFTLIGVDLALFKNTLLGLLPVRYLPSTLSEHEWGGESKTTDVSVELSL